MKILIIAYLSSEKVWFANSIDDFNCVQMNRILDPARNGGERRVGEQHRFPLSSVAWENRSRRTLWVSQKLWRVLPLSPPLDHTTVHAVARAFYFPWCVRVHRSSWRQVFCYPVYTVNALTNSQSCLSFWTHPLEMNIKKFRTDILFSFTSKE